MKPTNRDPWRVVTIVLAAGFSRRMGQPKATMDVGGMPMLARVLRTVREADVGPIVVVLGKDAAEVQRSIALDGLAVVHNPDAAEGIASSLRRGVEASGHADAYLVVLGDMPMVRPSTLAKLVAQGLAGARILVPTHLGVRGNPVLLHGSLGPTILELRGDRGFRPLFQRFADELVEVPVDDPGVLQDVDTPEDLEDLRARLTPDRSTAAGRS